LVWSGGFYLTFVWMAIFMQDLIDPPVQAAFGVNSCSLLLLALWFPLAGAFSDLVGRKMIMTVGGILFGIGGPIMLIIISSLGSQNAMIAFGAQTFMAISIAMWGAPMCAWLVEAFEPEARLTSVSIGYNVAQAIGGGLSPFVATLLVDEIGTRSPGILLAILSFTSLLGLWCVAPKPHAHMKVEHHEDAVNENGHGHATDLELTEIT